MAGDYYSGGDDETAPMEAGADTNEAAEPQAEEQGEPSGEHTELLSKDILGGKPFNVDDELVLRIVAFHDGQVEVAYAKPKSDKGEPEARSTGDSMTRMAKYADKP